MHIYEYLFAGIIIFLILIASSLMIDTLSQPARDSSKKDELKITAEKVMMQILLDPGFPFDWGTNLNEPVQTFGLAKYGETTREAYMLDSDKVQRLNPNLGTDYYVPPSIALQSLNLGNDYGFTLEIAENLNVSIQRTSSTSETFNVAATSYVDQMPVANTKITGALYAAQSGSVNRRGIVSNVTGYDGACQLGFSLPAIGQGEVLIVVADYYGARSIRVFAEDSQTITGYLLGNQLITSEEYQLASGAQPAAKEVLAIKQNNNYTITDFTVGERGADGKLVLENSLEPSAVAVIAATEDDKMLVAYRNLSVVYRSIDFPDIQQRAAAFAYSLERNVLIGGTTYTATLYIWRMAN